VKVGYIPLHKIGRETSIEYDPFDGKNSKPDSFFGKKDYLIVIMAEEIRVRKRGRTVRYEDSLLPLLVSLFGGGREWIEKGWFNS
jgi:hypothetical protein